MNQGLGAGGIASLPIPYSSLCISVSLCELSSFIPTGDAPSACQREHTTTLSPSVVPGEENFFPCLYINPRLRPGDIRPPLGPMNLVAKEWILSASSHCGQGWSVCSQEEEERDEIIVTRVWDSPSLRHL